MYVTRRTPYLLIVLAAVVVLASRFAVMTHTAITTAERAANAEKALLLHANTRTAIQNIRDPFPDVQAEGTLVRDLESGETIYAHRETEPFPIASLTKLMTAAVFEEFITENKEYTVSPEAKQTIPKVSAVPVHARISGENILKLMLVESANDAALIAAEKIGTVVNFNQQLDLDFESATRAAVSVMNDRAVRLGMNHTNFVNPIGLDDPMQYASPDDLFTLIRHISDRYPALWHIASRSETSVAFKTSGAKSKSIVIRSTTPLFAKYPRIIAAKTGTTDEARQALVIVYQLTSGKNIAIILLRSDDRFEDAEKIIRWLDTSSL